MNNLCLFVSDLHGKVSKYEKLMVFIENHQPKAIFIGGDILPSSILHSFRAGENKPNFISDYLAAKLRKLKEKLQDQYPRIFIIMGNDDPRIEEDSLLEFEREGLWEYAHGKIIDFEEYQILGYNYVPPTPFLLKDWERYDIDQQVQPGCIHPQDGFHTVGPSQDFQTKTIQSDLTALGEMIKTGKVICLFHSPPYNTGLDRVALDGVSVENHMADVHVGSRAMTAFIERFKPHMTLHGHIHESSRLTGVWKEKTNHTVSVTAAYEGPGFAVVEFDPANPFDAERIII